MESLQHHVDQLFQKYRGSKQIEELKWEVLSNLEAKVADLVADGLSMGEAVRKAKANLPSIDSIVGERRKVYMLPLLQELLQLGLLYGLIAWIVTMPLRIWGKGIFLNYGLFAICMLIGIVYLVLLRFTPPASSRQLTSMNVQFAFLLRKTGWMLWALYIVGTLVFTTALYFGSNLWFSTPVNLTGPYQFANIAVAYALPFLSILIPLWLQTIPRLILKYDAGEGDLHAK
ncbi:permease prefix domain 1-containing protein [Brevibacillus sp. MER 51]|uniref:permease prefix domain 1-containing protein n=1 Tax=Brevibacillus sp. MER 51 TaxID=2939560 RepID=UPI00203C8C07|nr:permease prefix domain 1-containing protein [Brevibacillus sp. MER 51]MCM3144227.1 permease prefix domain 1-containing protein [Brevibacillus sp. MER 51]